MHRAKAATATSVKLERPFEINENVEKVKGMNAKGMADAVQSTGHTLAQGDLVELTVVKGKATEIKLFDGIPSGTENRVMKYEGVGHDGKNPSFIKATDADLAAAKDLTAQAAGNAGGEGEYKDVTKCIASVGEEGAGETWGSTDDLMKSATTPGKGGVSPVGRAFQKHAGNPKRAGTFVGEVSGNAVKNTEQGAKYISDILSNSKSTFIVNHTDVFGDILDVRLSDGTGATWSADGKKFIGFLEKYSR